MQKHFTVTGCFLLAVVIPCVLGQTHGIAYSGAGSSQSRSRSSSSSTRELLQAQAANANNKELPRLVIGKVKATVVNEYSWRIQRQSSASGVAVTADGYSRKQLGYTLTFTRSLVKTQYHLEGVAAITNPSGQGSATLQSVNILVGVKEVLPNCQGMPQASYTLAPAAVIECPFAATWDSDPGADAVSGYVQASFGRAAASDAPISFSFQDCGKASSGDGSAATVAACVVQERAACVSVSDGSYIINKYKDKLGQNLAGTISRSRLFEVSSASDSTLGPPRFEPALPPPTPPPVPVADDVPAEWRAPKPDPSWWTGSRRHRKLLLLWLQPHPHQQPLGSNWSQFSQQHLKQLNNKLSNTVGSGSSSSSSSSRLLLQSNKLDQLVAQYDANFQWPYPQVTGDRPPIGLEGKSSNGAARQICDSRSFSFGMIWGPLLPGACGVFEVQNMAAALPMDGSSPAITHNTYTYLNVLCPAKTEDTATATDAAAASNGARHL